jgi:cystathionine beta-lyase/cystathionine gamma-synthase
MKNSSPPLLPATNDGLLRVSVGIEDPQDIQEDFTKAVGSSR